MKKPYASCQKTTNGFDNSHMQQFAMLDCSSPSFKILSSNNFIVPCIASLLDSIHPFVQNLHKICYFMGLCVFPQRYIVLKTHMMHVVENISSYLYMHHNVLDAQHPCAKNTNS